MPLQAPYVVQSVLGRNNGPIASYAVTLPNPVTPGNTLVLLNGGANSSGIFNVLSNMNYLGSYNYGNFLSYAWYRVVQPGDGQTWGAYIGGDSQVYTSVEDYALFEISGQPTLTYHGNLANATPSITGTMQTNFSVVGPSLVLNLFVWDLQVVGTSLGPVGYTVNGQLGDGNSTGGSFAYAAALSGAGSPPTVPVFGTATWSQAPGFTAVVAGPVNLPSVQIASNPNAGLVGKPVAFTITVTGSSSIPTGTVTVTDSIDGTLASALPLVNGMVSFTSSALSAGNHTVTASYSGNVTYAPNNGTVAQVMGSSLTFPASTALSSTMNPSFFGDDVTFDITVSAGSAIVQSASHGGSVTAVVTLGSTPTPGNTLLAFGGINLGGTPVGLPLGFSYIGSYLDANVSAAVGVRVVQPGDGTAWTFTCANNMSGASNDFYVIELPGVPVVWAVVNNYTSVTSGGGSTVSTLPLPGGSGIGIAFFNRTGGWGTLSGWGPSGYATPAWLNSDAAAYTGTVPNAAVTAFLSYASTEVFAMAIEIYLGQSTPTGSVDLTDSIGDFSPQTLTLSGGTTSYGPISSLSINTHSINAAYGGA